MGSIFPSMELVLDFLGLSPYNEVRKRKRRCDNIGFANFAREIVVGTIILIIGAIVIGKLIGLM
jgi:nitric oxide reductase large subunit